MILIASSLFPPEPVVSANLSYDLAEALGVTEDVVVVSPKPTRPYGMKFDFPDSGVFCFKHVVLKSYTCPRSSIFGRLRESYSFGRALEKYIEENSHKIEVIYANVWPLFAQKILADISARFSIPLVLHVQDIYPESLAKKLGFLGLIVQKIFLPIDIKVFSSAVKVVTISSQMKKYLAVTRRISIEKIVIVRNWQNDAVFLRHDKLTCRRKNKKFCYLFLGSVNPTAGVDILIHAFGRANIEDARLVIAGSGPDRAKCEEIASHYSAGIEFLDVLPSEVPSVQSEADILIMPLRKGVAGTGLPSKMTAYMFSAKPIMALVDKDSEAAQIVTESQCGWVVEPENSNEIINAMRSVRYMDKRRLIEMGESGCLYATQHLTKEKNLRLLVRHIKDSKRVV